MKEKRPILRNRFYLYLTEFFSGMSVMSAVFSANLPAENDPGLRAMMQKVFSTLTAYVPGDYLLTDDKAPVELLGMRVIDELIRDEVAYYKAIYKEGGLKALLNIDF